LRPFSQESNSVSATILSELASKTEALKGEGLYKKERMISGPQQADLRVRTNGAEREVINLCANNCLGLANHPAIIAG